MERSVLNTRKVKEFVESHGVVTLIADWTRPNKEIDQMLESLKSKQIPVLAIFPANNPNKPIVLQGIYSQSQLLEKLAEASPQSSTTVAVNKK